MWCSAYALAFLDPRKVACFPDRVEPLPRPPGLTPSEGGPLSARLAIGTLPEVLGRGALRPRPKAEVAEPDQQQHRPQVREQVDG